MVNFKMGHALLDINEIQHFVSLKDGMLAQTGNTEIRLFSDINPGEVVFLEEFFKEIQLIAEFITHDYEFILRFNKTYPPIYDKGNMNNSKYIIVGGIYYMLAHGNRDNNLPRTHNKSLLHCADVVYNMKKGTFVKNRYGRTSF